MECLRRRVVARLPLVCALKGLNTRASRKAAERVETTTLRKDWQYPVKMNLVRPLGAKNRESLNVRRVLVLNGPQSSTNRVHA